MRLALDAMGGDHAPAATVEGALLFARAYPDHEVILVGDRAKLEAVLAQHPKTRGVIVHHASEVVEMDEHAGASIRKKKDSSLRVCFELAKKGEAAAVVSAGNSGACMAGALLVLGRLRGVDRPAIATLFPALKGGGRCLLLDAGANVDCKPEYLAQFAVMGEAYVRALLGVKRPRIGVLSNGEEAAKGTELTRAALELIGKSDLEFKGYVEGKDIFSGDVEVVVTDGFTGNVVLKTSEGVAAGVAGLLRTAIEKSGLPVKVGALLLKPAFAALKKAVDYAEYGGAPLLGVDGVGVVAHGRSSPKAIMNALSAAMNTAQVSMRDELIAALARAEAWLPSKASTRGKGATVESISE
jgi:glycerol-3-phosphate acyltransferase PlsX